MTFPGLVDALVHRPAVPVRVQLVTRLADDLRAAIGSTPLQTDDLRALDSALAQVMNGWNLSVSRFLRVEDDVETVLTRAEVERPAVEAVLRDLEDVFLSLWNQTRTPAMLATAGR